MKTRIIVIGLGQSMRGDDGAGPQAVRQWQESFPETAGRLEVRVETLELPGLDLLSYLDGMDAAILVDAVQSSALPGTLHRFRLNDTSSFTSDAQSAHGWGVAETLQLGCAIYPSLAKCRVILIGLAGKDFEMGAKLSPEVEAALPEAVEMIQREVSRLLNESANGA
ncbi:MAG: hydrogenase maturation protease [Anaerolineales bacterium]|nr:hydrogenase maturation protease [Anaerolineales bacterium]